jgi:sugar lactone lactonase YvrE
MRTGALALLVSAVLSLAPGCGVGGLIAISAGGGGGGGGGGPPPPPPSMTVTLPGGPKGANFVSFIVHFADPRVTNPKSDLRVRIDPEWSLDGGATFHPMTEAQLSQEETEGTRDLVLSADHKFAWNTLVDLGNPAAPGTVKFRFGAQYEDAEGIKRKFVAFEGTLSIDNRLAATIVGADARPDSDVDTFPQDLRADGDGFLVACLGANVVERVDSAGRVSRVVGFGVPGSITFGGQAPGVAHLPLVFGVDHDAAGNVFTTHESSVVVTNRGDTNFVFGLVGANGPAQPDTTVVPPRTAETVIGKVFPQPNVPQQIGPVLASARAARLHPSGVLLLLNGGAELLAVNFQDPSSPASTTVTLGGIDVGPGEVKTLVGGGASTADGAAGTDTQLTDAIALAVGPDGEIYVCEHTPSRVRVFNAASVPLTIAGAPLAVGTVRTVAGGNGAGRAGDGGPAASAQLNLPNGVDVSPQRVLYVADTSNLVVRAANLSGSPQTFAGTTVGPGNIDTVVGGGVSGGEGSSARDFALKTPNNVAVDANGNLLVADAKSVYFVNGSAATAFAYGKTALGGYVASVYSAEGRGGLLLVEPRAMLSVPPQAVYFTDRSSVRVMNLGTSPAVFGGASADGGGTAIVGGGAVTGFAGDDGPARTAAFSSPSALAAEGPFVLYVADTGNDRVRAMNADDPRLGPSATHPALGVSVAAGAVTTVVGGGAASLPMDGDGLAPASASLSAPQGLAVSNAGLLFVADTGHHRIRVVNPGPGDVTVAGVLVAAGSIRTVVGDGVAGFTPDGPGPWHVDTPTALAIDRDLLYFADSGNARIRVLNVSTATVSVAGVDVAPDAVATICGRGARGNDGEFGHGFDAAIDTPRGFALQTLNGDRAVLYFADGPQEVVRALNLTASTDLIASLDAAGAVEKTMPHTAIVNLAGGPNDPASQNAPGFDGDGREASAMRFDEPWGVAVATFDGGPAHFFVADSRNGRIRRFGAPPLVPR